MRRAARIALGIAAATAVLAGPPAPSSAAESNYTVLKCHSQSRSASEAVATEKGAYTASDRCLAADARLEVTNRGFAGAGQKGSWTLSAPPGTYIAGARLLANIRRDNHHRAQILATDAGGRVEALANGSDEGLGFQPYAWSGRQDREIALSLTCSQASGCAASDVAHAYATEIELVLVDSSGPEVASLGGTLLAGSWIRGAQNLSAQALDAGSGLESFVAVVNGVETAHAPLTCGGILGPAISALLAPCPTAPFTATINDQLRTYEPPFVQGWNTLRVCARSFAGPPSCALREIAVDNVAPGLAFASSQDPDDPERIVASVEEPHSGLATAEILYRAAGESAWTPLRTTVERGLLAARVDSASHPAGSYEFRAQARDGAGNLGSTTARTDGTPMVLAFPLRAPAVLSAGLGRRGDGKRRTLRFHESGAVAGRLTDSQGAPIGGAEITIEELFAAGSLVEGRSHTVVTDADGAWRAPLPAGPSRTVRASFAGSRRYAAASAEAGTLEVRGAASFRTSRTRVPEGGRVVFRGHVGHRGARMPAAGKLIELQVREAARRWITVREAFHTNQDGGYRLGYRFGRFYQSNAVFRFRLKVTREEAWPYRAPVRSRARSVVVVAR